MAYRVQPIRRAQDRLTALWIGASSPLRRAITAACNQIERVLARSNAPQAGFAYPMPAFPTARGFTVHPLTVRYVVMHSNNEVYILDYELTPSP